MDLRRPDLFRSMHEVARRRARRRALFWTGVGVAVVYLSVRYLWSALVPVIGAGALYYLFAPAVRRLAQRGVPRALSGAVLVLAVLGTMVVGLARVAPRIYEELLSIVVDLPRRIAIAQAWLDERGLGAMTRGAFEKLRERAETIAPAGLVNWTMTAFGSLTTLGLTAVLAVYLLAGGDDLARSAADWIPPRQRERWLAFGRSASRLLSGYVRARVIASTFIGASYWVAFVLLDVPQALLLAVVGGLLNLIPVIGPLMAAVPALAIAAFQGLPTVIGVAIVMIAAQQVEGSLIGPLVEGRFVRLPPPVVVFAVAVGAALQGIPGMLIAVPIAALTREALNVFYRSTWTEQPTQPRPVELPPDEPEPAPAPAPPPPRTA